MALKCIIYCAYKELHSSAYEQRGVVLRVLLHSERLVDVHMAIYHHHCPQRCQPAHSNIAVSKKALLLDVGTKGRPHSEADL